MTIRFRNGNTWRGAKAPMVLSMAGSIAPLALLAMVLAAGAAWGQQAPGDTLILVNADPITVADVDAMVLQAHESGRMEKGGAGLVRRMMEKRVNDLLILQDALAAGMDQEPEVLDFVADKERDYAIQAYVRDHLTLPEAAPEDSVRAYFERYYWRIQVRQLSVRTRAEAEDLRRAVLAGADMDSLARAVSLDTKKLNGGMYKLLHWADVENVIRDQVRNLPVGEISPVFPFREAYAFVRVEQREPVDKPVFASVHDKIAAAVLASMRQEAWDGFVDSALAQVPVTEDMGGLFAIAADSAQVLTGEFLKENSRPVLEVQGGAAITGTDLRKAISHEAMKDASRPFAAIMSMARQNKKRELVLDYLATRAGYHDDAEVNRRVDKDWEELLIETYLQDTVASRIRFKKGEFEKFYQQNLDRYRGPDEVRLEIMILDDEDQAREAAAKLAGGADFGYVYRQYNPGVEINLGQSSYIQIDQLSQPFRDQLEHMSIGQSSEAVEMPMGWMVFQLADRRPGTPPPLPEVEMDIRKVIYQQKFNKLLDEQLDKLKSQATIIRFDDGIAAYFNPPQED